MTGRYTVVFLRSNAQKNAFIDSIQGVMTVVQNLHISILGYLAFAI